jgi:RimJ/RimL family protein N-acetyltransferase
MDISLIATRTYDSALIKNIMFEPAIFDAVAEDGKDPIDVEFDVYADCWVEIRVDEDVIGVYNLHPHNSATLEIHAHILPEFRKKYSLDSGKCILQWVLDKCPEMYQKVIAQVPVIHENVKKFCIANGFKIEGVNRMSYRKNGKLVDQTLLGITRSEIEGFLND